MKTVTGDQSYVEWRYKTCYTCMSTLIDSITQVYLCVEKQSYLMRCAHLKCTINHYARLLALNTLFVDMHTNFPKTINRTFKFGYNSSYCDLFTENADVIIIRSDNNTFIRIFINLSVLRLNWCIFHRTIPNLSDNDIICAWFIPCGWRC